MGKWQHGRGWTMGPGEGPGTYHGGSGNSNGPRWPLLPSRSLGAGAGPCLVVQARPAPAHAPTPLAAARWSSHRTLCMRVARHVAARASRLDRVVVSTST